MSHEVLLISGDSSRDQGARRLLLAEHAASHIPGAQSWKTLSTPTTVLAIVATRPLGGTVVRTDRFARETRVTLALSEDGASRARKAGDRSRELGAEAAHISIRLPSEGGVCVATDGTAFIPSFWAHHISEFFFSTHLASMFSLGLPAAGDVQGMLEYLVMLHPLGERTIFERARLLTAGTELSYSSRGNISRSTKRLFVPSDDGMSDDEAIRELATVWPQVIADLTASHPDTRLAVGLSGGLDSRFIASEFARQGYSPLTYTYGSLTTREASVATRLADALSLDNLRISVTPDRLMPDAIGLMQRLDGSHSPAEMYEDWFADQLRDVTQTIVNGLAGGPLWGDEKALGLKGHDLVLSAQLKRYTPELARLSQLLSPDIRDSAAELIRSGLSESLQEWDTDERSDAVVFWKAHNRQFRWGNMLTAAMRRNGLSTAAPFLDGRFLRYAARLTPAQRLNGRLYLRAHTELYPDSALLPRSDDGNALVALDHVYWTNSTPLALQLARLATHHPTSASRRAIRRLYESGTSVAQVHASMNRPADRLARRRFVFPSDLWLRTEPIYRQRLIDLLEASPAGGPISQTALASSIASLREGRAQHPLLLAKVGALNAWLLEAQRRSNLRSTALLN